MLAKLINPGDLTLFHVLRFPLSKHQGVASFCLQGSSLWITSKSRGAEKWAFSGNFTVTCCPAHVHGETVTSALRYDHVTARTAPGLKQQLPCNEQEAQGETWGRCVWYLYMLRRTPACKGTENSVPCKGTEIEQGKQTVDDSLGMRLGWP